MLIKLNILIVNMMSYTSILNTVKVVEKMNIHYKLIQKYYEILLIFKHNH